MFFDRLKELCAAKGISAYKACTDVGLNRAAVAKWKNGSQPNGATAVKLADYFGVSVDFLLGNEKMPTENGGHTVDLNEVDFAFYGGYKELSEDDQETLRDMVRIMRERRKNKG